MTDPTLVAVLGDVHGNTRWVTTRIPIIARALKNEDRKTILQCGDFLPLFFVGGDYATAWRFDRVWEYLYTVEDALAEHDVTLMFIDGNHEDWEVLNAFRKSWYERKLLTSVLPDGAVRSVKVTEHIWWLPRGYRWQWHDRTWLAFGGAGSPNAGLLTKGWNWWEDELITDDQVQAAVAQGRADVLVSHDLPSGVYMKYEEPLRHWKQEDLDTAERQREKLQVLADGVQPAEIFHGHHHRCYAKGVNMDYGPVQVTGLGSDGDRLNYLLVDVKTMMIYTPGETPDV